MNSVRYCPQCRHQNDGSVTSCAECGAVLPALKALSKESSAGTARIPDTCEHPGCQHTIGYGVSTRGGGPFYCWRHGPLAKHGYVDPPRSKTVANVQVDADLYCRQHGLDTVDKRRAHIAKIVRSMPAWKLAGPAFREPGCDDDL